jgi:pimeloyl-ACP methyl ester carboxylesterase
MKRSKTVRALVGAGLCGAGLVLALPVPFQSHTFRIDAGGCRLVTDIVEPKGQGAGDTPRGYVVLLHGLSANKRIMSYATEGFALQGLRVFVPDLPGHGRSDGPFSFERADQCSENLLRELVARGLVDPERTILAGHSMGGAIALRVASREPVAGAVAISPAPVRPIPGLPAETMPFRDFEKLPAHSLLMNGSWEAGSTNRSATDLMSSGDATSQYLLIPRATHVSILFDGKAMSAAQNWAVNVLHIERHQGLPSHGSIAGFLLGLAGILTLTGAFVREILENKKQAGPLTESATGISKPRAFLEFAIIAFGAVGLLHFWIPLRALHLFEGDYLASLLLVVGVVLLLLNWNSLRKMFVTIETDAQPSRPRYVSVLAAGFGALLLYALFGAWCELSFMEAWPTAARMVRFLPVLVAVLPAHLAEELLLGPANPSGKFKRLSTALALRLVVWIAIVAGIFLLHSGEILPVVLVPSFALFCLGQRWGMDVVREVTASAAAAALFGAILLAGFCLVVFPTT